MQYQLITKPEKTVVNFFGVTEVTKKDNTFHVKFADMTDVRWAVFVLNSIKSVKDEYQVNEAENTIIININTVNTIKLINH